jgi:DNA-binding NarL/FixJ family response regulator
MSKDIRVLLVDDHEIVRDRLRRLLELQQGIEVVGEATDGEEALSQVEVLSPDVVLMDVKMPKMNGIEATRRLKEKQTACKIIMLTMYEEHAAESIKAGADSYLLKGAKGHELAEAIREVCQGEAFLVDSRICVEELDLIIPAPANADQVEGFAAQLKKALDAKVTQETGSPEQGNTITVRLEPAPLATHLHNLREMPAVARAEEKRKAGERLFLNMLNVLNTQPTPRFSFGSKKRIVVTLKQPSSSGNKV